MQLLMKLYSRVGRHDKTALFLSKSHTIRSNLYYVIVSTVLCSRTNIVLRFPSFWYFGQTFSAPMGISMTCENLSDSFKWTQYNHSTKCQMQTCLVLFKVAFGNLFSKSVWDRSDLQQVILSQDLRDCSANNNWLKLGQSAPQASPMNSEVRLSTRTLSSQRSLSILSTCTWDGTWWQSPQLQLSSRFASKDQILVGNWLFLASSEGRAAH